MTKLIVVFVLLAANVQYGYSEEPVEWEHGWKTSLVTATRYRNEIVGYNIGFKFPKNCDDSDREDLFVYIESFDGFIYQGGGYSCAEVFVKFKAVKDRASADTKLKKMLPLLTEFIRQLK